MVRVFGFVFFLLVLVSSCKKDKEIIIDGNTPPPDGTIPNVVKENYVNKSYISVLGRKPTDSELLTGMTILNQHNLSVADRNQLLDAIFLKPGGRSSCLEHGTRRAGGSPWRPTRPRPGTGCASTRRRSRWRLAPSMSGPTRGFPRATSRASRT